MTARVLVIDDSPMTVQLISEALSAAGIVADSAGDLASLDERLDANTYDVVLVDVNMPEMYGDDVVEFLRVQRKVSARLFLYSDLPEQELMEKMKHSGADGYVAKSQGLEAAVETIRDALEGELHARRRVLLVDGGDAAGLQLKAELEARGHEVITAGDAESATKVILKKKTRPDVALLDVAAPSGSAETLSRFIKGNSLFAGIRVVLCSAAAQAPLERLAKEYGADAALAKNAQGLPQLLALLA